MVCSCQSHRDPDGSKRLIIFVQRRLAASRESFGKGIAVLFTSVINKLTWDEARVIVVAGRRQASTPKTAELVRRQQRGSQVPETKSILSPFSFRPSTSTFFLHQPSTPTSVTATRGPWAQCCDPSLPSPLNYYIFVLYTTTHFQCLPCTPRLPWHKTDPNLKSPQPDPQLPISIIGSNELQKLHLGLNPTSRLLRRHLQFVLKDRQPWQNQLRNSNVSLSVATLTMRLRNPSRMAMM
jgi:hypothetical protein